MTSTKETMEILKQDSRGRVLVPMERRRELLEEFERSGMSGAQFARLTGIKYATFANWRQKRDKEQALVDGESNAGVSKPGGMRLLEAVVDGGSGEGKAGHGRGLLIELPGGSGMRIESPVQMQMAAELVALIAERMRRGC
jgi:hypothetical protein